MPAPVYTETFLRHATAGSVATYTVPAGKRAIVTTVTAASYGAANAGFWVGVSNLVVWIGTVPVDTAQQLHDVRLVAYAGQTIQAFIAVAGLQLTVCGYLFDDLEGGPHPFMEAVEAPGDPLGVFADEPPAG